MKLSITQENLNKALSLVSRVVSTRTTLPVLANVLIKTDKGRLKLSATNLEVGLNYWTRAKVEEDGALTVPARLFGDFISSLPQDNIELSSKDTVLNVKATNFQSSINGISAEEFPLIPQVKKDPILTLPAEPLREAILETAPIASLDEARPVLTGVYMYTQGQELVMAATDSYRLAEKRLKLATKPDKVELIVPARTLQELARILAETKEDIQILSSGSQVMFVGENIELTSRLIDGQFPNYQQIIPVSKPEDTVIQIERSDFEQITKVASLFTKETAGSIRIEAKSAEGLVNVVSTTSQVGENISSAGADIKGSDAEISLNSRYLMEALAMLKSEDVKFTISGKLNPCVLSSNEKTKNGYTHIIMPLRT